MRFKIYNYIAIGIINKGVFNNHALVKFTRALYDILSNDGF